MPEYHITIHQGRSSRKSRNKKLAKKRTLKFSLPYEHEVESNYITSDALMPRFYGGSQPEPEPEPELESEISGMAKEDNYSKLLNSHNQLQTDAEEINDNQTDMSEITYVIKYTKAFGGIKNKEVLVKKPLHYDRYTIGDSNEIKLCLNAISHEQVGDYINAPFNMNACLE